MANVVVVGSGKVDPAALTAKGRYGQVRLGERHGSPNEEMVMRRPVVF